MLKMSQAEAVSLRAWIAGSRIITNNCNLLHSVEPETGKEKEIEALEEMWGGAPVSETVPSDAFQAGTVNTICDSQITGQTHGEV